MGDGFRFVVQHLDDLLIGFPGQRPGGLVLSIFLAGVGIGVGFALAGPIAMATQSSQLPVRILARAYVWVFRGVPLVLLLLVVHQFLGTGSWGVTTTSLQSALITLVLYSSAYQADILEGGVRSVPSVLVDDARVLGASRTAVAVDVRLRYAVRVNRPALASQAITVFKDSSVVVVLGVADLTTTARIVLGSDVDNAPHWVAVYLAVGALYFVVAAGLSRIVNNRERSDSGHGLVGSRPLL